MKISVGINSPQDNQKTLRKTVKIGEECKAEEVYAPSDFCFRLSKNTGETIRRNQ
ncbi:MAG: hypothetical protein GX240_07125 [Candidatus Atribacteria bacterium]|nr:hypothetical protein [Candidatus Atribacteria bacterium]